MSTYTGQGDQEGMRKTNFCPESNPGLMTSKPAHQTLSHDHQTKVCPLIPSYNCSGRCLTGNLTLQTKSCAVRTLLGINRYKRECGDRLLSGDRGSVSGVLVCWSLDLGSTPDRSLSFSFPLDHLSLRMLTSNSIHLHRVNYNIIVYVWLCTRGTTCGPTYVPTI